jgi:hypothetical protein
MASDQELAAAREQIARYEKQDVEREKSAAIARELGKFDLAPGAAEQLTQLIAPSVGAAKISNGNHIVVGPEYRPLDAHVSAQLARPEYAHFLKPKADPAAAQAAPQSTQPGAPSPGTNAVRELLPGENVGAAILRVALAEKATQRPDPRLDTSQPLAIGRRAFRK